MNSPRYAALLLLLSIFSLASDMARAATSKTEWKAGFAAVKITPSEPLLLSGYASRSNAFTGVLDDLHVKALALEDAEGRRALWITADLIGFRAEYAEPACERITARTKIPRERILLNASHTHTGPSLALKPRDGGSDEQSAKIIAYTRRLQDQCVELALQAVARLQPARLTWGGGVVNFPMNRREFTGKGVILGVNPRGPVDRGVPVLRVESPAGKLLGVVFGAACHNTTFGGRDNQVSGDYAGAAQRFIESEFPGAQAMFMQGLAGDANPYPNSLNDPAKRPAVEIAREHGAALGREVARVLKSKLTSLNSPLRTAFGRAELPLQKAPPPAELERLAKSGPGAQRWAAGQMLARLAKGEPLPAHYAAPVAVWQFGEDLTLVTLSGEVVVDYARLIEDAIGPLKLWLAAYSHDVFGYVPSARVLREGGYETRGMIYGGPGFFAPEVETVLVQKVRELAAQAGRSR
ncbi:MAG: neutral/alkaline non-lysosomal ceramidase N-terminal domain-containing protein [Verrucomicrobia bacterium]|nr:neutral/alkaline non-lysosomal ceramidase N-terminal domain-containing protein [Verrucomicrobiota bacterium]